MEKKKKLEPYKIILAKWVDKPLQQSLKKQNIKFGFKVCKIWPLNFATMARKFGPNEVFTLAKEENPGNSYHSNTIV